MEFCCTRLCFFPLKQSLMWSLPRSSFYNIHMSQGLNIQNISPLVNHDWPFKMRTLLNSHLLWPRPLLTCLQQHVYQGKVGLKYQSNHKRDFVKEVKRQDFVKAVKGHEVIRRVRRAIIDRRIMLHQTEESLKKTSRLILSDIRKTRSKIKGKMEEIIERENVYTVPNMLCVTRIALSPYLGYLILEEDYNMALCVLTVAGVTDLLDGWIARTFKSQSSKIGSFLDPMADKILIATMFLALTYSGIIPVVLTGLIISRDVILVGAGFVIRFKSLPPPRTLSRYFDVSHATAQLAPTTISKVNTVVQLVTVACTLAAPVFGFLDHTALHCLWYLVAATTVTSASSYLVSKNTFKFLKKTS